MTVIPRLVLLAALAVLMAGLTAANAAAAGPSTLGYGQVTGLKQSTGNLYWTTFAPGEFGPSSASLWRASKSNIPGSEVLLYRETRNDRFGFGDLTYANVGDWYGYVAVNYYDLGIAQIKRVPLAGGAATSMVQVLGAIRDVDTDGSYLYWADTTGVRRMPVGGGTVTTLVAAANVTHVGLGLGQVFYTVGASVRSVPPAGGPSVVLRATTSTVTALSVQPGPEGNFYDWGEANGWVKAGRVGSGSTQVIRDAVWGRSVRSVFFDGTRTQWTDCLTVGGNDCAVWERSHTSTAAVALHGVGSDFVQADSGAIFWGDVGALRKYTR